MKDRKVKDLTAAELYEAAQQKEAEEIAAEQAAMLEKVAELKQERKDMLARHRKELREIERQISEAGGVVPSKRKSRQPRGQRTELVLDVLRNAGGEINTDEIRVKLDEMGAGEINLSQVLGVLKKKGVITSPARAVYEIAD